MSRMAIWIRVLTNPEAALLTLSGSAAPSRVAWISWVLLAIRNSPPQQQDQVSARDSLVQHGEERLGETHHPGQREQQQDAGAHGEPQPQNARFLALSLRQAADQDGDKDDVVDAQHDFEQGKGRESNPGGGIKNPFQHD